MPTQPLDFSQLIQEIDVDIRCFDNEAPTCHNPIISNLGRSPLIGSENESLIGPPTKDPLTKPQVSNPTQETNTSTPTPNLTNPVSDKKWVRIQRPTHIPAEENVVVSLGKRSPPPILEYSRSQKRRTTNGDDSSTPSPETAAAGR